MHFHYISHKNIKPGAHILMEMNPGFIKAVF
jgi:hypothetical protein